MPNAVGPLWRGLPLRTRITIVLVLWAGAESLAFALVVRSLGLAAALLLGLGTSLLGASLVKRLGRAAFAGLRQGASGGLAGGGQPAAEGVLAALAAVLLLVPGFLSDALGLVLAVPAVRAALAGWLGRGGMRAARGEPRAQHGPREIDLERGDWRTDEDARRPLRER